MPADLDLVRRLGAAEHGLAIVTTTRADGSVHASLVNAGVLDDPVGAQPAVGAVVRADTVKLRRLRRTQRATIVFRSGWEWVAVDGPVTLIGPHDTTTAFDVDPTILAVNLRVPARTVTPRTGGGRRRR